MYFNNGLCSIIMALCFSGVFIQPLKSTLLSCETEDEALVELAAPGSSKTGLVKGDDGSLLILSTLDGSLIGIEQRTGNVRWKLKDEPLVKVPIDHKNGIVPMFLPNPKDGSLYLLGNAEDNNLKKLPFTIQQLVASSPCRSTDGVFYTGKKLDSWFSVDWKMGHKESFLSYQSAEPSLACPVAGPDTIFIGRTEYSIMMYDSVRGKRQWNVTFFDYSAHHLSAEQLNNYEYVHFGTSSTGRVATVARRGGALLWQHDYGSPLIGIYVRHGRDIATVPFTSVEEVTLDQLPYITEKLYPSLYVGEHLHGLYALPSLVGRDTAMLAPPTPPLLAGPMEQDNILLGHYRVPDYSGTRLQITGRSDPVISPNLTRFNGTVRMDRAVQTGEGEMRGGELADRSTMLLSIMVGGLTITVAAMFLYLHRQVRDMQSSRGSSQRSVGGDGGETAVAEDLADGTVRVGKISFHADNVLGKGCEGTFVFRGEFEGRGVAVKRLLPECFTFADREVCLLRESDAHPNVVRYFCTETDKQFRYIALELCAATLQEYVEKGVLRDAISGVDILRQATAGLDHLHSLNIVHRDVKPHNVLLSLGRGGAERAHAMISDFGLCKKLQAGRASFSRRSGVTGTDGWIAPEMMTGSSRTMCAVDIFSLGCVFYYVLSGGKHPFGDQLRRQANILAGDYSLASVEREELWRGLVASMLSSDSADRPPTPVVLSHPAFWDNQKALSFLQDVSDRVENEGAESRILVGLESGASAVCGPEGDWRGWIDTEVATDLRKYRNYRGDSVRDLLRALRNKKHHLRELSTEAQALLGSDTDAYLSYWTARFPLLLAHSWYAMQPQYTEPSFRPYYCVAASYTFPPLMPPPPPQTEVPSWRTPKKTRLAADSGTAADNWRQSDQRGGWKWRGVARRRKERKSTGAVEENYVWSVPPS